MNYTLITIFSYSIVIPGTIGLVRFTKINQAYYPFIYCLWIGLFNEILSTVLSVVIHSNAVNGNIYVLLESLIICWQFKKWDLFGRNKFIFPLLLALLVAAWLTDNFILSRITRISSYFRIFYSFIIVLLSISLVNYQIVRERRVMLKNPATLISLGFIAYYTYKVLVESFWIYGLNENSTFRTNVYSILAGINLISNLIYALAILWMPTKHRFTLPY